MGVNDQIFYKKSSPAAPAGTVSLRIDRLPRGSYEMELYQTGYQVNDAYTAYLEMGAPDQLARGQVDELNSAASGIPVRQLMLKHPGGLFVQDFSLRQNDVVLVLLRRV